MLLHCKEFANDDKFPLHNSKGREKDLQVDRAARNTVMTKRHCVTQFPEEKFVDAAGR
jgi:hypothetical protein